MKVKPSGYLWLTCTLNPSRGSRPVWYFATRCASGPVNTALITCATASEALGVKISPRRASLRNSRILLTSACCWAAIASSLLFFLSVGRLFSALFVQLFVRLDAVAETP